MKTGYVILISTVTSVAVVLLLFFCFNRFANWGIIGSRIAEQRHQQGDAYKMLGRMGEAMKDYAGVAMGASGKTDEDIAYELMGKNFDFVGDVLKIAGKDDPLLDATADFYDAAGELFSEPEKVKSAARDIEESVNRTVEEFGESINNFFDSLF